MTNYLDSTNRVLLQIFGRIHGFEPARASSPGRMRRFDFSHYQFLHSERT